jgi:hypothetical protein
MAFSAKQTQALRRNLDGRQIRTRESNGRELSYIEGWYVISEANRIFGFDAWGRETVETRCVLSRENRGTFNAVYVAKVRITVHAAGTTIIREGHGSGEGRGTSPGEVHDKQMPPKEHLRRSADHSALNFIGRTAQATFHQSRSNRYQAPIRRRALAFTPMIRHLYRDHRVTTGADNRVLSLSRFTMCVAQ